MLLRKSERIVKDSAVIDASGAIKILAVTPQLEILHDFKIVRSPTLYWFEIGNVCWKNQKFGNWSKEYINMLLKETMEITVLKDYGSNLQILGLARHYEISFYDASYLMLAHHYNSTIISFDKKMNNVAQQLGLETSF